MRASVGLAYPRVQQRARYLDGWLRAGLKSSAYRLAHLVLPRRVTVTLIAALFYFG
jgi:hypothetical protein